MSVVLNLKKWCLHLTNPTSPRMLEAQSLPLTSSPPGTPMSHDPPSTPVGRPGLPSWVLVLRACCIFQPWVSPSTHRTADRISKTSISKRPQLGPAKWECQQRGPWNRIGAWKPRGLCFLLFPGGRTAKPSQVTRISSPLCAPPSCLGIPFQFRQESNLWMGATHPSALDPLLEPWKEGFLMDDPPP